MTLEEEVQDDLLRRYLARLARRDFDRARLQTPMPIEELRARWRVQRRALVGASAILGIPPPEKVSA
jgi:hypothetical protein